MVTMVKLLMSTVAWLLLAGRGCASPATKWAEESEVWEQQLDMVLDNQEVRPGYIYISHCTCIYLRVYLHISTCVSTGWTKKNWDLKSMYIALRAIKIKQIKF